MKIKMVTTAIIASSMVSTGALAQSLAQPAPSQEEAKEQSDADSGNLNEIVVVAQKRVERLGDVPVSVGVVQADTIERLGLTNMEQLSKYVPTFNVSETGSGNRITLRGISSGTNRGFEQSVGMFVDGIYGGRAAQFTSPFFDVERVEVLRGPQSVLFGKNTVAGAISIVTATPGISDEIALSGGYETEFGGFNLSGIFNKRLADNLQMRVAYRHDERDKGFLSNLKTGENVPSRLSEVARMSVAWQPGEVRVNAKYEYSRAERQGSIFQLVALGTHKPTFARFDPLVESDLDLRTDIGRKGSDRNSISAHNASLRVAIPIGRGMLTSDTGYSAYATRTIDEDSDMTPVPLLSFHNRDKFSQFSTELRYSSPAEDSIAYTFGGIFLTSHFVGAPEFVFTGRALGYIDTRTKRDFDQHDDTYSAFGELNFELADSLHLIGGGRYVIQNKDVRRQLVVYNLASGLPETSPAVLGFVRAGLGSQNFLVSQQVRERQFTPAATLQYKPSRNAMIYAKYSRGFKSGGFDASDTMGTVDPYKSESIAAYEAGFKWTLSPAFTLNAAAYYSKISNLQVSAFNGLAFATRNAAKGSTRGVEVEASLRPVRGFTLSGSLAYQDARYDDYRGAACTTGQAAAFVGPGVCTQDLSGRTLTDAPHWSGSVNASYTIDITGDWRMVANAGANLRSSFYVAPDLDMAGYQKGYGTFDLSAELFAPGGDYSIAVIGKNIGDKRAMTSIVNVPLFSGAKSASIIDPRTIEIRASVKF